MDVPHANAAPCQRREDGDCKNPYLGRVDLSAAITVGAGTAAARARRSPENGARPIEKPIGAVDEEIPVNAAANRDRKSVV